MALAPWIFACLMVLGACNDKASFKVVDEGTGSTGAAPGSDDDATGETPQNGGDGSIKDRCAKETLKEYTQTIQFPNPGQVCEFGKDDNLSRVNLWVRARREQAVPMGLPAGAIVCKMEFTFPEQSMRFDDEIFLLYDGVILAGSLDLTARLTSKGSLYYYDWKKFVNAPYDPNARNPFCLGEKTGLGQCRMPYTETTGPMNLSFDASLFEEIAQNQPQTDGPHQFGFVTTGDNDNSDCQHSDLSFEVKALYIE